MLDIFSVLPVLLTIFGCVAKWLRRGEALLCSHTVLPGGILIHHEPGGKSIEIKFIY